MKRKTLFLGILLTITLLIGLSLGRYNLSFKEVLQVLTGTSKETLHYTVVYGMRLPRIILVVLCGSGLALAGHVYQVVFRNPLVSPDILGVSAGCSFGAAFAMVFLGGGLVAIGGMSFLCGVGVVTLTMYLSKHMKNKTLGLVLWGIVTSSIASSGLMLIKYSADPYKQLPTIEFWLMGGFYQAKWEHVGVIATVFFVAVFVLYTLRWKLKVMMLGDEAANALGVDIKFVRYVALAFATFLVASIISLVGLVSWIGLIAPHLAKLYTKREDLSCMGIGMIFGSLILLIADTCARSLFPAELPISILTSFMGAVVLSIILIQSNK